MNNQEYDLIVRIVDDQKYASDEDLKNEIPHTTFNKAIDLNKNNTYIALCSCMIISIVLLIIEIKPVAINFVSVFTSILAFLWGYIFAKNVKGANIK